MGLNGGEPCHHSGEPLLGNPVFSTANGEKQQPGLLQYHAQTSSPGGLFRQDNGEEREKRSLRFGFGFGLRRFGVFFIETFHPSFGIHNFLSTREKRMATGTDIDL